ncbi:MAG TPA: hypothetical protein VGM53_31275 [Streptosporangiaceae bacterium]
MTADEEKREVDEDETAFDRFRDLARKLVQVPKREIDAEHAGETKRRPDEDSERD